MHRTPQRPKRAPKHPRLRTRAGSPGAATKRRRRKPPRIVTVQAASKLARNRWLKEPRTLMEVVADLCEKKGYWSLITLEDQCLLPRGTLKQMRFDPTRRFGPKCARAIASHFGAPFIAAANPNEPIGKLVEWEERALAAPRVLT